MSTILTAGTLARRMARIGAGARRRGRLAAKAIVQRLRPRPHTPLTLFVAGVQRSGTNMVMDVLERSLDTQVFHERDPRAFERYEMRPVETIRALRARCRAPVMVVKALCELDLLPQLLDELAPARAVWIYRDWRDSVRSQLRSFPRNPQRIRRMPREPNQDDWIGRGLTKPLLDRARELLPDAEDDASVEALFWWFRNALFFVLDLDQDPRVRLVRYEDAVREPGRHLATVFSHAGLALEPAWARDVSTASIGKGRRIQVAPRIAEACGSLLERLDRTASTGTGTRRRFT